jgi:hypothetical protein
VNSASADTTTNQSGVVFSHVMKRFYMKTGFSFYNKLTLLIVFALLPFFYGCGGEEKIK